MEIKRPKIDTPQSEEELDSLPAEEIQDEKPSREHELELELARKEGELSAIKKMGTNNGQMTIEQTKAAVFADINNLSDDDFHKKYPQHNKHSAMMTVMDASERQTKAEAKELHASSTATAELSTKYGQEFYRLKSKILEDAGDLADSARQDPDKLTRWMERQFLALSREGGKKSSSKADDRRKVVNDFEAPTKIARADEVVVVSADDEIKDETPDGSDISNQKLAHLMGIRSEKERKGFAGKDLIYVDMDLTCKDPYAGGEKIRFGDPKRGFERVKIA